MGKLPKPEKARFVLLSGQDPYDPDECAGGTIFGIRAAPSKEEIFNYYLSYPSQKILERKRQKASFEQKYAERKLKWDESLVTILLWPNDEAKLIIRYRNNQLNCILESKKENYAC